MDSTLKVDLRWFARDNSSDTNLVKLDYPANLASRGDDLMDTFFSIFCFVPKQYDDSDAFIS